MRLREIAMRVLLAGSVATGLGTVQPKQGNIENDPRSKNNESTSRRLRNVILPDYEMVKLNIQTDNLDQERGDMPLDGKWLYIGFRFDKTTKTRDLDIKVFDKNIIVDEATRDAFDQITQELNAYDMPKNEQEAQEQLIDVIKKIWHEKEPWSDVYILGVLSFLLASWSIFLASKSKILGDRRPSQASRQESRDKE